MTHRRRAAALHAVSEPAPEPLDLRLAAPAAASWAAAWWAVGQAGPGSWRAPAAAALVLGALALPLGLAAVRHRIPRHRLDPRPGASPPQGDVAGSACAGLLVCVVAACAVLVVSAGACWARERDPVTAAVAHGRSVTVVGTVTATPRTTTSARSTTVLTEVEVSTVDGADSSERLTVLGGQDWLEAPMGAVVRVRTTLEPSTAGARTAAIVGRDAGVRVLEPPTGTLGRVTGLREALARAVDTAPGAGSWSTGAEELVPGIALGDDHALHPSVRQDMRTVNLTHLTAVSGQHVALVMGTALTALGAVPHRPRAVVGAVLLVALVVLVRPSGSVLRAATMGAVLLVGVAAGRRSVCLPALCAAVIALLLVDPRQARDLGLTLSVAATAGILLGTGPLTSLLPRWLPRPLAAAVALPVAAQAACGPVLIGLQPTVGVWSVPANLLAAPVVPLITLAGMAAALVAPWWPWGAGLLAWPAGAACSWIVTVARVLADLPGALVPWPAGPGGALVLAACEAGTLAVLLGLRRRAGSGRAGPRTGGPWQA
ncbi:MAG: ComEC/Rec2 family competence protein [Actinomyces sp.]|uniref:ComEC/Rec2 family competence protein n=1 Tax=Actinomyces sp. TaxID=29317 RepID=UPI0026DAEE3D|nr:ComEC/Rec2 family competence protein [Actinomyces sp.]MDO4242615.1 ComEC/Rec2 family competence protein [Actinomyces sp.]